VRGFPGSAGPNVCFPKINVDVHEDVDHRQTNEHQPCRHIVHSRDHQAQFGQTRQSALTESQIDVGVLHVGAGRAQTAGQPEHFSATYVDINTDRTGSIDIDVTRWSTNKEREALVQTLFKQGSDQVLSALRDQPSVGRIYTMGSIGYESWVQFQMRKDGTGEEKLAIAARIIGEEADRVIEVEDFATQPVTLQDIKSRPGDR
jgi:hypothetical protein